MWCLLRLIVTAWGFLLTKSACLPLCVCFLHYFREKGACKHQWYRQYTDGRDLKALGTAGEQSVPSLGYWISANFQKWLECLLLQQKQNLFRRTKENLLRRWFKALVFRRFFIEFGFSLNWVFHWIGFFTEFCFSLNCFFSLNWLFKDFLICSWVLPGRVPWVNFRRCGLSRSPRIYTCSQRWIGGRNSCRGLRHCCRWYALLSFLGVVH